MRAQFDPLVDIKVCRSRSLLVTSEHLTGSRQLIVGYTTEMVSKNVLWLALALKWPYVAPTSVRVFGSTAKQSVFQYSSDTQSKIIERYAIVFSVIGGVVLLFAMAEIVYTIYLRRSFAKVGVVDQAITDDAANKRDTEVGEESKTYESDHGGDVSTRGMESTYTDAPQQVNRRRAKLVLHKHSNREKKMDIRVERHGVQMVATTPPRDHRLHGGESTLVSKSNPSSPQGRKRRVIKMKMSKDGKIDSAVLPL